MTRETYPIRETLLGAIQHSDEGNFFAVWIPNTLDLTKNQDAIWFELDISGVTHENAKEAATNQLASLPDYQELLKSGIFKAYFYKHDVDAPWHWQEPGF